MDAQLTPFALQSVPRYTSYPTAAEFTPAVGAEQHAAWLGRADPDESVSLYLHVPYCRDLCHYCGCHTKATHKEGVVAAYRESLEAEIRLVAGHLPGRLKAARIAWGGGTPSILGGDGIAAVMAVLEEAFDLSAIEEHAIELDPRFVDAALARRLADLGVTRVSLGVQDLDPVVQVAIGRVQPEAVVAAAVGHLRAAGIEGLNIDLIYGLPHQTEESVRATCRQIAALGPDRVACFGYAHLPQRKANQRLIDEAALPGTLERFRQAAAVAEVFSGRGYQAIGLDHYARLCDKLAVAARQRRLRRNFQGYTDDDRRTLIGFGASAVSQLPDGFVQTTAPVGDYRRGIAAGVLPTARGIAVGPATRQRAIIIERLMCDFRVDLDDVGGIGRYGDIAARLQPYEAAGLATLSGSTLRMTAKGRPFVRLIAALFDEARSAGETSFSRAI
ncbi:MAG: oxygen-independent coproporphyrinogen III oxidase [Aurantimonas endophytica]|uniref:oxygen-independent coproporphyrinogen III oxidase n=1 Tax=Aurantimonas endophytica TaxID=1522175 RepID=UPI0030039799